jgi:DNA-binding transcriptional MerR regulator
MFDVPMSPARHDRNRSPANPLLSIGVFARRSRLSMKALRLHDRLGLLTPADVDPGTSYRRYRESQLVTARLIVMLRRLDMPLARVAEIVSVPGPLGAERLTSYWEAFERRVAGQRELMAHIRSRLSGGEEGFGPCEIRQREVPEQLVLSEQRHVQLEQLPSWIGAAMGRLMRSAQMYGGAVANPFVIYHGEVNEDSDGPAEACVPIDLAEEGAPDQAMRREPAHNEVYVRLRKAQVGFPQILSAYDSVAGWVTSQGLAVAGSPREVYFTDFVSAGPADEVCDVALPIERTRPCRADDRKSEASAAASGRDGSGAPSPVRETP